MIYKRVTLQLRDLHLKRGHVVTGSNKGWSEGERGFPGWERGVPGYSGNTMIIDVGVSEYASEITCRHRNKRN